MAERLIAKKVEVGFFFGEIGLRVVTETGDDLRIVLDPAHALALAKGARRAHSSATKGEPE